MIQAVSEKEKSSLLEAIEIALGVMHMEKVFGRERPLSAEETAGHAWGDPFMEHGLVAAGKKLCGMCGNKAAIKGVWECIRLIPQPAYERYGGLSYYPCPAPEADCPGFLKKPSIPRPPQPKKKSMPVPEGVKFLYVGRPEIGDLVEQGIVTVAWIEPSPGILHMGFSFCSPKDRWCKVTGRDMALVRLLHPVVVPCLYSPQRTVHEVTRAVLSHDFGRLAALSPGATMWGRVPMGSWTKALAKRMTRRVLVIGPAPTFDKWKKMDRNVRRRFLGGAPSIDLSLGIIGRMMQDIAALGND